MDIRTEIEKRAAKIVHDEDRRFSREGKGRGFLDLRAGEKDEARRNRNTEKLADWLEKSLKGKSPELLDNIKDEDIRKAYVEKTDPLDAGKKLEFSAFKDIIEPPKGKRSWYDMDTEQLRYAMKDRGYKPEEMPEFLEKVSEHQQNYDIGKAVDEGLSGPTGALTTILAPVASREAVRQSYDKGSAPDAGALYGALGADALALNGMLLAPGMKAFSGADELANIVKLGATDAGLEGTRQFYDIISNGGVPTEENLKAPVYAGVAAATVPALSSFLGSYLSRGGSEAAKPFAQGFRRGTRGGMDPVTVEAENIKQKLINAKAAAKKGYADASEYVKQQKEMKNPDYTSDGYSQQWKSFADIGEGATWADAQKILMDMGYPSLESALILKGSQSEEMGLLKPEIAEQIERLRGGNITNKPYEVMPKDDYDINAVLSNFQRYKEPNSIDVESSQGMAGRNIGEPYYVEDIIGWRPGTKHGFSENWWTGESKIEPYTEPSYSIEKALEVSLNPKKLLAQVDTRRGVVDDVGADLGKKIIERYAESAPEHARMAKMLGEKPIEGQNWLEKLFGKTNAERYARGLALGRFVSGAGTRLEPAGISLKDLLTNPYGFVKSKRQYAEEKNREKIKDEQLKKAIEEALKGGK